MAPAAKKRGALYSLFFLTVLIAVIFACSNATIDDLELDVKKNPEDPKPGGRGGAGSGGGPTGGGGGYEPGSGWYTLMGAREHRGWAPYAAPTVKPVQKWVNDDASYFSSNRCPIMNSQGTLFLTSYDGLHAINPDTGVEYWLKDSGIWWYQRVPTLSNDEGTIYVVDELSELFAISAANGSETWSYDAPGGSNTSCVVGADNSIYFGASDTLYSLDQSGNERWTFEADGTISTPPSITNTGLIIIGTTYRNIYAINPSNGSIAWETEVDFYAPVIPVIGINGTMVYIADGTRRCYAIQDGVIAWDADYGSGFYGYPGLSRDGNTLYISSGGDQIHALNTTNGLINWSYERPDWGWMSDGGIVVDANGNILCSFDDGYLVMLDCNGREVWEYELGWGWGWESTIPIVGKNGYIYVIYEGELFALGAP